MKSRRRLYAGTGYKRFDNKQKLHGIWAIFTATKLRLTQSCSKMPSIAKAALCKEGGERRAVRNSKVNYINNKQLAFSRHCYSQVCRVQAVCGLISTKPLDP